jgi:hypothetical protein
VCVCVYVCFAGVLQSQHMGVTKRGNLLFVDQVTLFDQNGRECHPVKQRWGLGL